MATVQELTPEGVERARGKRGEGESKGEEKQRRRRKYIPLKRIFNHILSFAVASQSFTIAQERWRGRSIRGGEGENMRGKAN